MERLLGVAAMLVESVLNWSKAVRSIERSASASAFIAWPSATEATTDRYQVYPRVLEELLPAAFHHTEAHANNPLETDPRASQGPPSTDSRG